MYNNHIYCNEYKDLKDQIVDILNGDIEIDQAGIDKLAHHIQSLHDEGKMSSSQYDDLMGYVMDMG